jgi:hypothetical protein
MSHIEKFCAPGVYDPPGYSQGIKVTGVHTILFSLARFHTMSMAA